MVIPSRPSVVLFLTHILADCKRSHESTAPVWKVSCGKMARSWLLPGSGIHSVLSSLEVWRFIIIFSGVPSMDTRSVIGSSWALSFSWIITDKKCFTAQTVPSKTCEHPTQPKLLAWRKCHECRKAHLGSCWSSGGTWAQLQRSLLFSAAYSAGCAGKQRN